MAIAWEHLHEHISPVTVTGVVVFAFVASTALFRIVAAQSISSPHDAVTTSASTASDSSVSLPAAESEPIVQPTTADPASSSDARASVTVNGQTYAVQNNGELHQTVNSANGKTTVDISVHSAGNGQARSSSSSSVHINSSSSSTSSQDTESTSQ